MAGIGANNARYLCHRIAPRPRGSHVLSTAGLTRARVLGDGSDDVTRLADFWWRVDDTRAEGPCGNGIHGGGKHDHSLCLLRKLSRFDIGVTRYSSSAWGYISLIAS